MSKNCISSQGVIYFTANKSLLLMLHLQVVKFSIVQLRNSVKNNNHFKALKTMCIFIESKM